MAKSSDQEKWKSDFGSSAAQKSLCESSFIRDLSFRKLMLNAKFFSFLSFEQYMIEQGALTINGIQDIAATTVQKCWRGYTVRKAFQDKKNLFLRHEQLKGQKRASAARTGDIFGNQSPYSVSPGSASPRYFKCR